MPLIYIIAITIHMILDILMMYICERYYARKCKYNCDECKNWHCQYHECQYYKKKLEENAE